MRHRAIFRVTNLGEQVWGVMCGWNSEYKGPVEHAHIPAKLREKMKPGDRFFVWANLDAEEWQDLKITGWQPAPEPDPQDGLA